MNTATVNFHQLEAALGYAARENGRYALAAVRIDADEICATDGRTLYRAAVIDATLDDALLLNAGELKAALKAIKPRMKAAGHAMVTVTLIDAPSGGDAGKARVNIAGDETAADLGVAAGQFPDYKGVLPAYDTKWVEPVTATIDANHIIRLADSLKALKRNAEKCEERFVQVAIRNDHTALEFTTNFHYDDEGTRREYMVIMPVEGDADTSGGLKPQPEPEEQEQVRTA